MLTYAFDLLYLIYEEEGYAPNEIPGLILKHNLYGLEICPRAAQLAELALVFKAREKSRRFFQPEHFVRPNIIELRDVRFAKGELTEYFKAIDINSSTFIPHTSAFPELLNQFEDAKNFGSLIQPCLDEKAIITARSAIEDRWTASSNPSPLTPNPFLQGQLFLRETHLKILRVLEQAEALTQRYHVVVANPPYLGTKGMNARVKVFVTENFGDFKADLFATFVIRSLALTKESGRMGFMTPFVWMFLSSFEAFRRELLTKYSITTLVQPEYHAFFESAFVPICAFSLARQKISRTGVFIRLTDFYGEGIQASKTLEAISNPNTTWRYDTNPRSFLSIPGAPIAYWISNKFREAFQRSVQIGTMASPRQGLATGENAVFLRLWHEVAITHIGFSLKSRAEANASQRRWFPYNKGGAFRRWYGNQEYVVNWSRDGELIRGFMGDNGRLRSRPQNMEYFFQPSVSWSKIGSGFPAFRYFPAGFIFDVAGTSIFANSDAELKTLLSLTNCSVTRKMLEVLSPTLNFEVGHIASLPVPEEAATMSGAAQELIAASRADWDNFETSWDFRDQPILRLGMKDATLEANWRAWEAQSTAAIRRMQELETENNRLFIAAYGLEGELLPEVPEAQITLARADARKDMAAFLSYAVGCMMGRYSLAKPGLILANAGDTLADYDRIIAERTGARDEGLGVSKDTSAPPTDTTNPFPLTSHPFSLTPIPSSLTPEFRPDEDGIIPLLDGEWFEDDIVARTRDFLRATFGDETLRENLRFIEDSLGKDLRKYFLNDFYKDHLQTYKKRPIYWLVQSPRKGFSVLIYLHRYTRDTFNLVLNRYLRPYQDKLRGRIAQMDQTQADAATSARDKTAARKELDKLVKTLHECEEWERQTLLPLAQQRIEIDLDDGVKVNYLKLGEALAPIPGLAAKEEE